MPVIEVLAPCGTMDALMAAVRCGATAVYLGTGRLNARRNAENFSSDTLRDAVRYCHARGVKVHLTLNTLAGDAELPEAEAIIREAAELGIDALILQDLGLFAMAKTMVPDMELHASTQLSVHTPQGVKLLEELGFHRVVLAREMSREEICACKAASGLPLEVFVHGALCMSVSGQCYLSAMLGSRSGNRGLCAQPCRLPFAVNGDGGRELSLKDLSLVEKAGELAELGVASLKIEGRMKRPEYVAAAVMACREALEGRLAPQRTEQLRRIFSRSGFTDGYYSAARNAAMFGWRKKEDVTGAASVLGELKQAYDKETPLIPCTFEFMAKENKPLTLAVAARGIRISKEDTFRPEQALHRPSTREELRKQLEKCGGTPFSPEVIHIDMDENLMIPKSVVNRLRRNVLDALLERLGQTPPHPVYGLPDAFRASLRQKHHRKALPVMTARFQNFSQIPDDLSRLHTVYVPLETPEDKLKALASRHKRVGVELPRGLFGKEREVEELLSAAKRAGIRIALCGNLGALGPARQAELELHGGFGLNCMNSAALSMLKTLGLRQTELSLELTAKQIEALGAGLSRGVLVYGRFPLMLLRNCPVRAHSSCETCAGKASLTDRKGIKFPVTCRMGCSELLNSRPVYLADRLRELHNIDFYQLYFTTEHAGECARIITAYERGLPPDGAFTRGLLYRGAK